MHRILLFLHSFNIKGEGLITIEFFTYAFKLVLIIFQRKITETKGELSLMKTIYLLQILNTRVKFLGLFLNKFSSW